MLCTGECAVDEARANPICVSVNLFVIFRDLRIVTMKVLNSYE